MTSAELIARLVESGQNYQTIGAALGRNRSLIRQVAIGKKPGRNLTESLAQMLSGTSPAPPERRRTRSGAVARVRGGLPPAAPESRRGPNRADIARRTNLPRGSAMPSGSFGDGGGDGQAWRIAGWSSNDFGHGEGYRNVEAGDGGPDGSARYLTIYVEGLGYRQLSYYPTDDFDMYDAIAEFMESYGEAYPR